jgi:ACS family hexuronate transporter-like MFS transporter
MGGFAASAGVLTTTLLVPIITVGKNYLPFFYLGAAMIPLSIISIYLFAPKIQRVQVKY